MCTCVRPPGCRPRLPRTLGPSWIRRLAPLPYALSLLGLVAGAQGSWAAGEAPKPAAAQTPSQAQPCPPPPSRPHPGHPGPGHRAAEQPLLRGSPAPGQRAGLQRGGTGYGERPPPPVPLSLKRAGPQALSADPPQVPSHHLGPGALLSPTPTQDHLSGTSGVGDPPSHRSLHLPPARR